MKKVAILIALVTFVFVNANALTADSKAKVKEFSTKEYTIIADGDTFTVTPGDTTYQATFAASDSVKVIVGKVDYQNINGKKIKIKQISANGKTSWVKADQDLSQPIIMWCDEDQSSDPISSVWYVLIAFVGLVGGLALYAFVFRTR